MLEIPEAVAVQYLRKWGLGISGSASLPHLGYPSRSTLHTAMQFHGPGSRSNVTPPAPEIDPTVWLVEAIVAEIGKESHRKAAVLRGAFCGYGTWRERLAFAEGLLRGYSGIVKTRISRRTYFRLLAEGIADVGWFLSRA